MTETMTDLFTIEPVHEGCAIDCPDRDHARVTVRMCGIGETWTLPSVHVDHLPTIVAAAESGRLLYGPTYSRQMSEALRDATRPLAHDHAESIAYFLGKIRSLLED